jgi:hypothetical protein
VIFDGDVCVILGVGRIGGEIGFSQQKRNVKAQTEGNREIRLPQEWTY